MRNVSRGGVLLEGSPLPGPGLSVAMTLRLPVGRKLDATGVVVRTVSPSRGRAAFAVAFVGLSADDEDLVGDLILRQLARKRVVRCLLASVSSAERAVLSDKLAGLGCTVVRAATPLEVMAKLDQSADRFDAIVLGSYVGRSRALDLAAFLAESYPSLRVILATAAGDEERHRTGQHVHATVPSPWRGSALRRALGLAP